MSVKESHKGQQRRFSFCSCIAGMAISHPKCNLFIGVIYMRKILRPKHAAEYMSISLATLWRLQMEADFPKKMQLSARAVGWYEEEIAAWLEKRKAI